MNDAPWIFRLYTAGNSLRSQRALANLKQYCEHYIPGKHTIEVINLLLDPRLAAEDQILALPTVVRLSPEPIRKVIGDLSDEQKVVAGLELPRLQNSPFAL